MIRTATVAFALLIGITPPASAEDWARKMFDTTDHDFGAVARGSTVEFHFKLSNIYQETVHISGVRSSCGCTTPKILKDTLKTYEEGAIVAKFNTGAFTGQKHATVTVTIDQPFYAEVQLQVAGYIRTDVVLNPPGVDFGSVDIGSEGEKIVTVTYAGRSDWQIVDVKPESPYLTASARELSRNGGNVSYELVVKLKGDAPAGYLKDHVVLLTNDNRAKEVPIDVDARITTAVTVSPSSLFLGALESGKKVTKQVVIQGKKPFRIMGIKCDDPAFEFQVTDASKQVHLVPVTFTAGEASGKITRRIVIETDLGPEVTPELLAYTQVIAPAKNETVSHVP